MADDTVTTRLVAATEQYKTGMQEAAAATATFAQTAEAGMGGTQKASESLLGAIAGGGHGRHLRLISMELGNLAGAGQLASRETFALLGGMNALSYGMETMAGPIGIVIGLVGALTTAYVYLVETHKKANAESKKENDLYREHLAKDVKEQTALIDELAEAYAKTGSATAARMAAQTRIAKLEEEEGKVNAALSEVVNKGDKERAANLRVILGLMDQDIAKLRTMGILSNAHSANVHRDEIDVNRLALAHEAAARRTAEAWKAAMKTVSDTIADALVASEFRFKEFAKSIEKEAARMAARKVTGAIISGMFGVLTGGVGSAALNFVGVGAMAQARSGSESKQ